MTEALETREGLSEPLRVLLKDYPREAWEADPGFSQLIQFWLSRHAMFRELCARITELLKAHLDKRVDPQLVKPHYARYANMLLGGLHEHHHVEDDHYFPKLIVLEKKLEHGFEILDRDHHDLTERLEAIAAASNVMLQAPEDDREAVEGALKEITRLGRLLDRHLWDEEELIVPVLLKHGMDD